MKLKDKTIAQANGEYKHPTRSPDREANERFVHLRSNFAGLKGRSITSVTAFIRNIDGQPFVSFAECDSRDQFDRRKGRVIARRKFFVGKRVPLARIQLADGHSTKPASLYDAVYTTYMES